MLASSRLRLFALVCAAALVVGCETASAAFIVDTSRLPRISGSREVYASPPSTSFTTRETVTRALELTASALINDEWKPYEDPSAARTSEDSVSSMSFKKEGRALAVLIAATTTSASRLAAVRTDSAVRNVYGVPGMPSPGATSVTPKRPASSIARR